MFLLPPNSLSDYPHVCEITSTVVLDLGTGCLKAGFAGNAATSYIIASMVGLARNASDHGQGEVGKGTLDMQDLSYVNQLHDGLVNGWDAMERFWEYVFKQELQYNFRNSLSSCAIHP
uniref:Uncharacterized protein n=1 Tax=Paramormyrops kingsleyae TaxID=1676925 RepID=A0A3B3SU00_9TELE